MGKGKSPRWLEAARLQNRSPPKVGTNWLARALSRAGVLPPSEAERAISEGRVRVNGQVQRQPLAPCDADDRVELDGRAVSLHAETRVLMLHKPAGVVSAGRDPEGKGTVFDVLNRALPADLRGFGWHAVGRLDRNTTGLLLFTNDERVVGHVTSPETHLEKRYLAKVSGKPVDAELDPLRQGMMLDDGPTRPAHARLRGPGEVELTLTEGRHHQVKRMLGGLGFPVLALHREAVGGVALDVDSGAVRALTNTEVEEGLRFGVSTATKNAKTEATSS